MGIPHTLHVRRVVEQLPDVTASMATSRKLQKYDVRFKLRAIQYADSHSKEATARNFVVDTKRIREWVKQKEKLLAMKMCGKSKRYVWRVRYVYVSVLQLEKVIGPLYLRNKRRVSNKSRSRLNAGSRRSDKK